MMDRYSKQLEENVQKPLQLKAKKTGSLIRKPSLQYYKEDTQQILNPCSTHTTLGTPTEGENMNQRSLAVNGEPTERASIANANHINLPKDDDNNLDTYI